MCYLYDKWDVFRPFCYDYCTGYINSYYLLSLLPWCDTNWTSRGLLCGSSQQTPSYFSHITRLASFLRSLNALSSSLAANSDERLGFNSICICITITCHCHSPFSSSHFSWLYSLTSFANNQISLYYLFVSFLHYVFLWYMSLELSVSSCFPTREPRIHNSYLRLHLSTASQWLILLLLLLLLLFSNGAMMSSSTLEGKTPTITSLPISIRSYASKVSILSAMMTSLREAKSYPLRLL